MGKLNRNTKKKVNKIPYQTNIERIFTLITNKDVENRPDNVLRTSDTQTDIKFNELTQKIIYKELILPKYRAQVYETKWLEFLQHADWKKVWHSIHNPLSTEQTTTTIWEQIHLDYYTTYCYNKWHNAQDLCPLCEKIPESRIHIILTCPVVKSLWNSIEPHLLNIYPIQITEEEKAFGLQGKAANIILRNWMTFLLRETIMEQESIAYYNGKGRGNENEIKIRYNERRIKTQIRYHYYITKNLSLKT